MKTFLCTLIVATSLMVKAQCTQQVDKVTDKIAIQSSTKIFKKFTDKRKLSIDILRVLDGSSVKTWLIIDYTLFEYALGSSTDSLFIKFTDKSLLKLPPTSPYGECKDSGGSYFYFTCDYYIEDYQLKQIIDKDIYIIRIYTMQGYYDIENLPKDGMLDLKKAAQCVIEN